MVKIHLSNQNLLALKTFYFLKKTCCGTSFETPNSFFLFFEENIYYRYSLKAPQKAAVNEYLQHFFFFFFFFRK